MKVATDTNVLLRALVTDDPRQHRSAVEILKTAESVAVSLQALCEVSWVLTRRYQMSRGELAAAIVNIVETSNVSVDRAAVEAGLFMLTQGSDFADGITAYEGLRLGGQTFVSFDKKAVRAWKNRGQLADLLQ